MLTSQRSKFMSLLRFRKDTDLEIQQRYLMSHKLLSMIVLVFKRLLFVSATCDEQKTMSGNSDDVPRATRRRGYEMCRDSIGDGWARISEDEFQIEKLSGGLTNYLYICSLPENVEPADNKPKTVLLRVYGSIATECKIVVQNSVIFALMSEKQLGPKLYGMNAAARIEELIDAKTLTTPDLRNPTLSRMIAKKLALFHSLDMPLCKEPRFLEDTMDEWMVKVMNVLQRRHEGDNEKYMRIFREYNLREELKTLKRILSGVTSPIVFSHNDLQEGNILYNEDENKMVVIDWEYCSYNYRGYDFGNHFLEWTYNYNIEESPYFEWTPENYPSVDQQNEFFRAYLQEQGAEINEEELDKLFMEANTFAFASHFLWGLWSILQNEMSDIQFGFLEYAKCRFEGYFIMKSNLPVSEDRVVLYQRT